MDERGVARKRPEIDRAFLSRFCEKWCVRELSLFGSVIREDFRPESDIDVLVEFRGDAHWDLFDLLDMSEELAASLGREVHLVEKDALRNPYRRREIFHNREVVYVA